MFEASEWVGVDAGVRLIIRYEARVTATLVYARSMQLAVPRNFWRAAGRAASRADSGALRRIESDIEVMKNS